MDQIYRFCPFLNQTMFQIRSFRDHDLQIHSSNQWIPGEILFSSFTLHDLTSPKRGICMYASPVRVVYIFNAATCARN